MSPLRWKRRREAEDPLPDVKAALAELAEAKQSSRDADRLWPRINRVADTLAHERQVNHFAERFAEAYRAEGAT